jgi:hypothetical protein
MSQYVRKSTICRRQFKDATVEIDPNDLTTTGKFEARAGKSPKGHMDARPPP